MATPSTPEPTRLVLAGMAGDSYGTDDDRAPLVLLHGLTFSRRTWRPVLDELFRVDPDRRVLVLDLPGHGESPSQLPHTTPHIVQLVHDAVREAGLDAPVLVGHSIAGGFVTVYPTMFPSRGAVNVDAVPSDLEPLVRTLKQAETLIRGAEFPAVWAELQQGFQLHALPAEMRAVVEATCTPRQEVAISYWSELFEQPTEAVPPMMAAVSSALAAQNIPYLLVTGNEPAPELYEFFRTSGLAARVEIWPGAGHFPHLARVKDFAALLGETGSWPAAPRTAG